MLKSFKGPYSFDRSTLENWDSVEKGVYYIGTLNADRRLTIAYIGKGCGEGGMKERLLSHLGRWRDVTHFGYEGGDYNSEIEVHEAAEIERYQPRYNVQGVYA